MKQESNILRGRMWLMLLVLLAWLGPQQAMADDDFTTYVDMSYNYSVSLSGSNTVSITVPCYDQRGADCWIDDGKLKVSWEGQSEIELFRWQSAKNINGDAKTCPVTFSTQADGSFEVTLGNTKEYVTMSKNNSKTGSVKQNSNETYDVTVTWYVPYGVLGRKLSFKWDVHRDGNSRKSTTLSIKAPDAITMPAAGAVLQPIVTPATLSSKSKGQIEMPWFLASDDITEIHYEYLDEFNKIISVPIDNNQNHGTIRLDATKPYKDFRVIGSYREKREKKADGTYTYYDIENTASKSDDLTMIHPPVGLTARSLGDWKGRVELTWTVPYVDAQDFALSDFFEIQRSLTGKEEDFVTIGQEVFTQSSKKTAYTYIDSTLIQAIADGHLNGGGTLDNLTYRVRRTISQIWGWEGNNCAKTAKCVVDNLHLLRLANYSATWEDERAYSVRVSWNYLEEVGGVWDNRAKLMMHIVSKNNAGNIVEDRLIEMNAQERAQCYKVVHLTRPCVHYDVEMYVDRNTSPLNSVDKVTAFYYPIHNASDWKTFCEKVRNANGQDVNARLYADITVSEAAGPLNAIYRGHFDGNGHTLTVRTAANERFMAPFRYVGNATFINLHTAGVIKTNERDVAGLVANVLEGSTVNIIGCRSSVDIGTTYDGESNNGGFVAQVNKNATISMRNCKYDGSIEGEKSIKNGGFIGSVDTGGKIVIDNSLFEPKNIGTSSEDCHTWARTASDATLTLINSYATTEYSEYDLQKRFVINSANDWHRFAVAVNNAVNTKDINAILMSDITISEHCGVTTGAYYRGTFDGNGHTITFNKSGWTEDYIAPFRYVGNATIKNLHTTGSIQSNSAYATGLVAALVNNSTVTIENCHSSVNLNCTGSGDKTLSGFVGRLQDCTLTIRNCKFDGSFEGANSWGHAGFVSWAAPNTNVTIENCLFDPNNISTKLESCQTWARKDGASSAKVTVTNSEAITHYSPSTIIIRSADDWDKFGQLVKDAKNSYWVDAILQADISVKKSVGFDNAAWRGTLHGNGHTINIDIESGNNSYAALFPQVYSVTITDLHVKGKVNGGFHSAGLIGGAISGDPTITLNHVWVSVEVNSSSPNAGGIIGHSYNANVNMNDVLFDGKVNTNNADNSYAGEIIGWCNGGSWSLQRVYDYGWPKAQWMFFCLDSGSSWGTNSSSYTVTRHGWDNVNQHGKTDQSEVVNLMNGREAGTWQLVDGNAVPVMQTTEKTLTETQLAEALGNDNWEVVDGKAVPKVNVYKIDITQDDVAKYLGNSWVLENNNIVPKTIKVREPNFDPIPKPKLPDFYHSSNGKIEKTLITETRQSSVVLAWDTDGNPIDYFKVMRRVKGQTAESDWKVVCDTVNQMSYEDKTVSPLTTYEYKVLAVNDCEGVSFTETEMKQGECKHTGRLDGYVRFNDGTGTPDINVEINYVYKENGETKKTFVKTVMTGENGYFEADELSYRGQESVTYEVKPVSRDGVKFEVKDYLVTFNSTSNDASVHEFIINNGKRFSGFVMYEGTSIPVKGANFLVNGKKIHNKKGDVVETDYDGSFSFRLVEGDNSIQAVMDNHVFTNEGWYKSSGKQHITSDIASVYFYDKTKVKLTGRIVGGEAQGKLPLDNNLSKNNLGDSLKMVLTLEGDDTSFLVYEVTNPNRTERKDVIQHPGGKGHQTAVTTNRKRMVVIPDQATGEYVLMLPPVRWKVQQVYCKGYPTLFQKDQVSEVIDLTNCLVSKDSTVTGIYTDVDGNPVSNPKQTYNAVYNRIYRSPIELTYKQLGFDDFDYFGDKNYMATNIAGEKAVVPLAYKGIDGKAAYTFGHPVFSLERKYYIQVQVGESYPYNNEKESERVDFVRLSGGTATMQNGMKTGANKETLKLDSLGQAVFEVSVDQVARLLTGEDALKTITFTAENDGTFYQAEPLNGYILNMFPIGESIDILSDGYPLLFDVLRDPPGAHSSATLSESSTMSYSYKLDMTTSAGLKFTSATGSKTNSYTGTVTAPSGVGTSGGDIFTSESGDAVASQFVFDVVGNKAYSYTMTTNHAISTSSDPSMVGADADLYLGMVQNMQVMPMSTIRALPADMYLHEATSLEPIAQGMDGMGNLFVLVRDESIAYGPKLMSQFIYSQKQILNQIIPDKATEILNLMYIGTLAEAKNVANRTQRPVYLSLRELGDPNFGAPNGKNGDFYNATNRRNSRIPTFETANDSINYLVVIPNGKVDEDFNDEVMEKSNIMFTWAMYVANNEATKLNADDLVANYDVAGAQSVTYSESFDTKYSNGMMLHLPFMKDPEFFKEDDPDTGTALVEQLVNAVLKALETVKEEEPAADLDPDKKEEPTGEKSELDFGGSKFKWSVTPVMTSRCFESNGFDNGMSRKESFTIAPDKQSRLNVDVYRVSLPEVKEEQKKNKVKPGGDVDNLSNISDLSTIFMNDKFKKEQEHILKQFEQEFVQTIGGPQGFVYRTRGGATANPWEDERKTLVYEAGTLLDARTSKINNPKIRLDKQSVSGVSVSDPARFKVYLTNESEKPEAASASEYFTLFADDKSNPNGAKISVDGQTLTANGMNITLSPGAVTEKTIEVRMGEGFDYEGLRLGVKSSSDAGHTTEYASFDVHFLREAGAVNISMPGDKWILNTNAQIDNKRGWYIPVVINGFDRYQQNFDHIEFQYKESQRGEDTWTNLCSYYADSTLMANANGVRELIPENGNIVTQFFGGSQWVTERNFDLKAVLFCRNGNSYMTTSSKIISGIKDTRRPQLFGTPEPKNGLLYQGNDIVFNFSEDIEYNYLSAITNFEVKGEVNNDNFSENVSVQFAGKASVETEAKRNFTGKNVTIDMMIKPNETGRDMPLFSHGTNGQKLQLWLTADFKLKAVVNDQTITSTDAIGKNAFRQIAVVINQKDNTLTFYNGGVRMGSHKLNTLYNGTGPLIFGRTNEADRNQSQYYEGRMMEARLWYAAMDGGLIGTTYGHRRLTGYEKDLVDYYPMNEGSGDYVTDHAQGANAKLMGAGWAIPRGMSLQLKKTDKGVLLDQNAINRSADHDYTLMFWFKTDAEGRGALLSNGRGLKEDIGAENLFHIGFEGEKLMYRSNGFAAEVPGNWSDNKWHNYAMTVNRARNVANIYIDKNLKATFEADSLGGISGGYPLIGATRYEVRKDNGTVDVVDGDDAMTGNVDELLFFAQALPQQLISTYTTKSPNGDEAGLMTYLGFDRQERQQDNTIETVPYAYSKKLYLDDKGKPSYQLDPTTKEPTDILVRDYLFVDNIDVIQQRIDATNAAPVVPYEEVTNLKFGFIGRGNQLMVELDEAPAKLNHRNIYVTVRDVEDKNGNTMASPQTACYFVNNSSLEWLVNRMDTTIKYGDGQAIDLPFYNWSAKNHTYKIENCPKWLTLNKYTDAMAPQNADYVTATISNDLNVGTYNEIIYLTDEDGIAEPFYLNLTVEGEQPEWSKKVDSDLLRYSMNVIGQVYLYDQIDSDSRDIVGVFDKENVCHGFANITHDEQSGDNALYLTVYDNQVSGRELNFRLWQYSTGRELVLTPKQNITFENSAVVGSGTPVRFDGGESFVQYFSLKKGWNWVSFNVNSSQLADVNPLLNNIPWKEGDVLTDMGSDTLLVYKNKQWLTSGSTQNMTISPKKSYAIKVQEDCLFPIGGTVIKEESARTIEVKKGWNAIGYTPMTNLSVETALSDYYDNAQEGDVIKSHTEFAYFSKSGNVGRWRGSLQYMKPGEGYMLLRKGNDDVSFTYPYYEMGTSSSENGAKAARLTSSNEARSAVRKTRSTMTLSATVENFEMEDGDRLVAYSDGEVVGCEELITAATATDQPVFFMSISGEAKQPIRFTIERDGETVAYTRDIMTFQTNAVIGSPEEPAVINFSDTQTYEEGKWYTIDGLRLQHKPTQKGVYIFGGKKVVIK